ncbi:MAG TPA: hypothetical protein VLF71_04520 [Candidatus Saccharimonadales bacterium]|nr:hypothetical protein [Candidatus Saccharimonadales bacterium]
MSIAVREGFISAAPEVSPLAMAAALPAAPPSEAVSTSAAENAAAAQHQTRRKAGVWACAAATVVVGFGYGVQEVADLASPHSACDVNVTAGDMQRAEAMLDAPDTPGVATLQSFIDGFGSSQAVQYVGSQARLFTFRKKVAGQEGLTVHDDLPYDTPLVQDVTYATAANTPTTIPFPLYMANAQDFLKQYGLTIEPLAAGEPDLGWDSKAPSAADLESTDAKADVVAIMQDIAGLPAEYVQQLTGVKHILLADIPPHEEAGQATDTLAFYAGDTVVVNVARRLSEGALRHEFAHGFVHTAGGPACLDNDPSFARLNNGARYSGKVSGEVGTTMQDFEREDNMLTTAARLKHDKPGEAAALTVVGDYENSTHPIFVDTYAGSQLREDQADTLRVLTQSTSDLITYRDILRLDCPAHKKLTLMAARLVASSKIGSRLLAYFAGTNERHSAA